MVAVMSVGYKPVGELAQALLSFKRPSLSVEVMVAWLACMIASKDILSNLANFTPPMHAAKQGWQFITS